MSRGKKTKHQKWSHNKENKKRAKKKCQKKNQIKSNQQQTKEERRPPTLFFFFFSLNEKNSWAAAAAAAETMDTSRDLVLSFLFFSFRFSSRIVSVDLIHFPRIVCLFPSATAPSTAPSRLDSIRVDDEPTQMIGTTMQSRLDAKTIGLG